MLNREKRMKINEDNFRELWANIKCTKIPKTGVPDRGEEKGQRTYLET